ncbi:glycosyl hydrolase 115 family protein [Paenibacillus camelliae]|uniref:glycosyl hydrolase 115 family protein n=1 Tax=Paenibacillus camelliae TaxID=512410 RepID=UPI00203B2FF8|nr:glycosyl hydrolase 115 family protein [Paenibacillus camelliae]MCM3633358.1 glycosyl hydrolase 115 family protein [Paenibacillus camelliae]
MSHHLTQQQYNVTLVHNGKAAPIYIDASGQDGSGLKLVAQSLASDIELVTGVLPTVVTEQAETACDMAIVAGTIGSSKLIDELVAKGKLELSSLKHKRESFQIQVIEQPFDNVAQAIVIVGSEKRGTFYGLYHISSLIGVSPWVYWGDVQPAKSSEISIPASKLSYTSKEPSIKYRGFFLNDEWPSLGSWAMNQFGGFNEEMYKPIFELVLRLKGNFMWPAMWSAVFSENGKSYPLANAELADAYGIVMGTSHHEPLFRAGEEWQHIYKQYSESNDWDFEVNREAITRFWEDGVIRNKHLESIITLGMRGERDSELGGTLEQNINRLKDIIMTQKSLLKKHGLEHAPQALVVYKEVEEFWHGSDTIPGLKHWDVLNDVTIMLSDDNFGNMRTLPVDEDRNRPSGWGIYYHFDYHGGPRSYEWVNTTPLEKVWEQMTMAFEYGIRDIWIVNVGDLKPNELPISYFMELAYNFEELGTGQYNKTQPFIRQWAKQQFGHVVSDETVEDIAQLLNDYTRMNGKRKPEVIYPDTYSFTEYKEAERMLEEALEIERKADAVAKQIPASHQDAYYQLVYYPAVASATVKKMNLYAGWNQLYSNQEHPSQLANTYAALTEQAIKRDQELEQYYNETMSGGKWRGMMSSPHVGYVNWNADGWHYPEVTSVQPQQEQAKLIVHAEGRIVMEQGALRPFYDLMPESKNLTISNGGVESFEYKVSTNQDWIVCEPAIGHVTTGESIEVSIDWAKLRTSGSGSLSISGAGQTVQITISAQLVDRSELPQETFIETAGVIAIEAEHTSARVAAPHTEWQVIEQYGRSLSSLKLLPSTASFKQVTDAPYVEYRIYAAEDAQYELTTVLAPSNPLSVESRLRYAVAFDEQEPVVVDTVSEHYTPGKTRDWEQAVLNNAHLKTTAHQLTKGAHTLRIYHLDAGIVLQKLVLSRGSLPYSYFGPQESYFHKG